MLPVYNFAIVAFSVLFFPYLLFRFLSERKHRIGLSQRLGFIPPSLRRGKARKPVIWVHSVSVGEVLAASPLIAEIRRQLPGYQLLLSTTTVTGQAVCRKRVAARGDILIYFPLDIPFVVRRVLSLFSPRAIILMETEIWPNLITQARRRGVTLLLVNGRLSDKSFKRYSIGRPLIRPLLWFFSSIGMQTDQGKQRMLRLGAPPDIVSVTGSLKYDAALSFIPSGEEVEKLRQVLGIPEGKVIVAGSTHRGEEQLVARAYLALSRKYPDLFLVIAPRHPERFAEVENRLRQDGIPFCNRSSGAKPDPSCRVMLLDTLGELMKFYAMATVAFVGKSLTRKGGQNPLEPAACSRPVVFGPHMDNFREVAEILIAERGAIRVSGFRELVSALDHLLGNEEAARKTGLRARKSVESRTGGVQRTMSRLTALLGPQGSTCGGRAERGSDS